MILRRWASAMAALALVLVPATPALAQKGPDTGGDTITLRVCNNTNDNARIAVSYQPVGASQFYNEGWYGVPARSCQDLATTTNAYMYGYAEVENDGTRFWSGDFPLCVEYPGPYAFWTYGSTCEPQQIVRNFVTMHADQYGAYTWNLDPP